jgi:hypothetical protein
MAKPKRPTDFNARALQIVKEATGQALKQEPEEKDPAAVERGRKGGAKGGKARAKALSPEKRREIARKAAEARWTPRESTESA